MVEILIGPIASGKSTYTKKRAAEGALVVNDDALVTAIHGGDYTKYDKDLKGLYKHIEIAIMTLGIMKGRDIVIDKPNFRRSTRKRWIGIAQAYEVKTRAVLFEWMSPEIHAERRMKSDARGHDWNYWLDVARRHQMIFQKVENNEDFDEILTIPPKVDSYEFKIPPL